MGGDVEEDPQTIFIELMVKQCGWYRRRFYLLYSRHSYIKGLTHLSGREEVKL